ncbi:MAG: flagellar basal body L-ring protein FlgH [Chthonomonas sp.]|nr:flagellar basal body L-ring protein FlgH [Chthonomonas sp.]
MQCRFLCLAISAIQLANAQVIEKNTNPGSLWTNGRNYLIDRVARLKGDVLTVVISESSVAQFSASTNTSKKDNSEVGAKFPVKFLDQLLKPFSTNSNSSTDGKGSTSQNGRLQAKITGVITEVRPNGTMVVEATRTLMINKELQSFKLRGVLRPDDIAPDNSVMSESLAEADIRFEGKGAIQDRQRRGLLTKVLDWLF